MSSASACRRRSSRSTTNGRRCWWCITRGSEDALPFGPFDPLSTAPWNSGLRKWVGEQTHFDLGYAEQLYTFGDRGRHLADARTKAPRVVSVGYLALTRQARRAQGAAIRAGATGIAIFPGRIGATPSPR